MKIFLATLILITPFAASVEFSSPAEFSGQFEASIDGSLFAIVQPNTTIELSQGKNNVLHEREFIETNSGYVMMSETTSNESPKVSHDRGIFQETGTLQATGKLFIHGKIVGALKSTANACDHNTRRYTLSPCEELAPIWVEATLKQGQIASESGQFVVSGLSWETLSSSETESTEKNIASNKISYKNIRINEINAANGTIQFSALTIWIPVNSFTIDGKLQLPNFDQGGELGPSLIANGTFSFENLTFENNRFHADMKGDVNAARLDNEVVDPSSFGWATAAVATAATGFIVWKLLGAGVIAGFTRISQEEALEHPKRQVIYDYVLKAPGATFREVVRETGYATGTTRHHLTILKRSKAVMEQKYAQTLRYYENHGKYDDSWDTVALLREPELAELHAWLMENPGMNQKSIIAAFDWSRSTVQHRLHRLVDGGLAVIRPMGRQNLYEALKSVQRT